ncbi:D-2-hydroxyacid dehydrogenase [Verrucomicrobiaceae bacterium R5-34]|nr:D-2-hydroxyacid dehydrogenase [Verrucomicrobiaceae bacterium R5-34]
MKLLRRKFSSALFCSLGACLATSASAAPDKTADSKALAEDLGSLRNAQVAIEMPDTKKQLTYFAGSISKEDQAKIARLAPNVRIVTGLTPKQALARATEAHGASARLVTPEFLAKASNLRWVQAPTAGVDRYLGIKPLIENDKIVMTNARGVHGPAIADHAMAMLLTLTRNLNHYAENQKKGEWDRRGGGTSQQIALKGKTMLVVGLGGIGSEIAQRALGFGMNVIGTRRSDKPSADYISKVGKAKDLLTMLSEADVVALAVPLTDETKDLMNSEAFAAMKQGSYLINIARGKVVNTEAMMKALKSGKLAGACLDVTDPEPLPADHPLWKQANVIITPHIASRAEVTTERRSALLIENLRRFGAGEPLLNCVDKKAGY